MDSFLTMISDINNGGAFAKLQSMHQGEHDSGGMGTCTGNAGLDSAYDKGFYNGKAPAPSHQGNIMNPEGETGPETNSAAWWGEKMRVLFGEETGHDLPEDELPFGAGGVNHNEVVGGPNGNYAD
jgi:hypothetical protein